MDKDKLKRKIVLRFKNKLKGCLYFKLDNETRLSIEYMYGGKYCLKRVTKDRERVLGMLLNTNDLVDLMIKERVKNKTRKLFK